MDKPNESSNVWETASDGGACGKPNDMKAKDLIRNQPIHEADTPPAGGQRPRPPRPGMPRPGMPRPGMPAPSGGPSAGQQGGPRGFSPEDTAEFEEMEQHIPGRTSMRPRGPFTPQETSMLKDLLLLVTTELMGNDFDGGIARKLMKGTVPDPGELQHIVDEVRRIRDLPEPHQKLMGKLINHINTASAAPGEAPAEPPPA